VRHSRIHQHPRLARSSSDRALCRFRSRLVAGKRKLHKFRRSGPGCGSLSDAQDIAIASSRFRNCTTSGASASHTSNGIVSSQASISSASSRACRGPCGAITPTSVKWPRKALSNCVRCETSISRVLWRIKAAWFSSERTPTNRIEGRVTASQIAAASDASFFCRRIYGFT
jgi:hypothetical protein